MATIEIMHPHDAVHVLGRGFVRLDDAMASDLSVVNSARVSYGKRKEVIEESDIPLIGFLMRNRHGTPFEHNAFRFHVKAPIFVFREWQRHRIGSFNEMSARYMELPADYYIPRVENVRRRVGKPGQYTYEPMEASLAREFCSDLDAQCEESFRRYKQWLEEGIAPEVARNFLHVNHFSEMYWTVNLRSALNFLNLRNAETAQWEIKQYAMIIESFIEFYMPESLEAFIQNGRVAP